MPSWSTWQARFQSGIKLVRQRFLRLTVERFGHVFEKTPSSIPRAHKHERWLSPGGWSRVAVLLS
jgi:hypothetical protein